MLNINQHTEVNFVIGYPLSHTYSPRLHQLIYEALHINAVLIAKASSHLEPLLDSIRTLSIPLCAVTMPFKEAVLPYLDELSPEVKALQAANTLIQKEGKLYGYNTDISGIEYALSNTLLHHQTALICGAGGAARALAYVLKSKGTQLYFTNRSLAKAEQLATAFQGQAISATDLTSVNFNLIANTTPLGLHPQTQASPLPHYTFQPHHTVFDMVYNPLHTTLLQQAKRAGATIISGLDMLIGQALKQVELWQNLKNLTQDPRISKALFKSLLLESAS